MDPLLATKWHTLEPQEIFKILQTGEHGLTAKEAARRLAEKGPNKLPEAKVDNLFIIFLRQFENPLIYILLIAGVVVLLMGQVMDAVVINFVLVFNAVVGAIQEGKARNTLLALKHFVETNATVLREKREFITLDEEIVAGDIIILQEGEKIPADARIISAKHLKVEEAALTGESEASFKHTNTLRNQNLSLPERKNMVYKGTHVTSGTGVAVVVEIGSDTVIGKIAEEVAEIDTDMPLKENIKNLSKIFILATIVLCVVLFILGLLYGYSLREMFTTAVSVAVSAIPSGLPIALTIILASGVWRMGKRNALVKRLQAVEALGQAQVIAVDKTGTITKNEMMVETVYTDGKTFEVSGTGYEPKGEVLLDGEEIHPHSFKALMRIAKLAGFCASARVMFSDEKKEWRIAGDPTEGAMLVFSNKLGLNTLDLSNFSPLIAELPFEYSYKYHATLRKEYRKNTLVVTGAPEILISLCTKILAGGRVKKISKVEKARLEEIISNISSRGLRVLAVTEKNLPKGELDRDDVKDLAFIGFLGLKDTLRPEVKTATRAARDAGLRVVMITGDHKDTAVAIAREALIYKDGDTVLTDTEIDALGDKDLREKISRTSVFARVTPEHKLRIINAYRARGEIVAMTGDGVNDAPSLVAADLGLAMGKIGTEVAKEASDIILLDDNFGSIVAAIEEGRGIYKTIKKVLVYLISTSIGEAMVILFALVIGLPLPLLAAQIIWLNFVTDGFFIPALAMEPRDENLLKTRLRKSNKYLLDAVMTRRMFLMATPMIIFSLLLFGLTYEADLPKAMTLALTILCVFQWFNAWNSRSETESIFKMNPWSNKWLLAGTAIAFICQLLAVYHPFFQAFLHTVPLTLTDWIVVVVLSFSIIGVEEARKSFNRKQQEHREIRKPVLI